MKDESGNDIKPGDVLIQLNTGSGCLSDEYRYYSKLWEMPYRFDGRSGFFYDCEGEKFLFAWVDLKKSIKIDMSLMPKGFELAFRNGLHNIHSKIKHGTVLKIIENSDWSEFKVKKSNVNKMSKKKRIIPERIITGCNECDFVNVSGRCNKTYELVMDCAILPGKFNKKCPLQKCNYNRNYEIPGFLDPRKPIPKNKKITWKQ